MIQQQAQKTREAALKFESIETMNEREREMVTIIRACFAEDARGNLSTQLTRLIQLRAYGNHSGDHTWLQTLTAFKQGISIQIHPVKFPDFLARGEQYVIFMSAGVGLINTALDNTTTEAHQLYASLGARTTGQNPVYTPPPAPPRWKPPAPSSPPPSASAEADDVGWAWEPGRSVVLS